MKTALVTGAAGFVGRHMATTLARRDYKVLQVDLRDPIYPQDALAVFRTHLTFDLVVHCAYHVGGREAIEAEHGNLARNVHLDSALFEWAVNTGQQRLLYFSSSAVYPKFLQYSYGAGRLHEDHHMHPLGEPDGYYGLAKLTGERMAKAAIATGVPVHIVRPFSGYGHDQDDTYPFRAFIERAKARADPFEIWGDGNQVRDWIHIDDVCAGALAIVDRQAETGILEPVNLCTGTGVSMLELAEQVCGWAGYSPEFKPREDKPQGVLYRVGDPTRMLTYYHPRRSLESGIRQAD